MFNQQKKKLLLEVSKEMEQLHQDPHQQRTEVRIVGKGRPSYSTSIAPCTSKPPPSTYVVAYSRLSSAPAATTTTTREADENVVKNGHSVTSV